MLWGSKNVFQNGKLRSYYQHKIIRSIPDSKCRLPTDVSPALSILAPVTSLVKMSSFVLYFLAWKLLMVGTVSVLKDPISSVFSLGYFNTTVNFPLLNSLCQTPHTVCKK